MAQRIEKQVIREIVCSKVSWHLDRGSPFCKMSDGSGRIRGMCGDGSEAVPYPGSGWKSLIDEEGVVEQNSLSPVARVWCCSF